MSPSPKDSTMATLLVTCQDRPGIVAALSQLLFALGINILDAQVFTWRNNVALDIFKVQPPPDPISESDKWEKTRRHLSQALEGDLDLSGRLLSRMKGYRPPRPAAMDRPRRIQVRHRGLS